MDEWTKQGQHARTMEAGQRQVQRRTLPTLKYVGTVQVGCDTVAPFGACSSEPGCMIQLLESCAHPALPFL